ncbi:LPS assembly lipoprotein LptE [Marinobacter sp. M-5]|uniref:LPS-assembly lipoprotein LptE n=1 Tax=Marinobacter sp. M-5 TaxID=3081089 RepID=UPI00293CEB55|nr:LPS assembly lipoprotein LptE [Marinobacter sp. M-5]MDV3503001.1 LPS assembly lipoprotein LptE [Marinobacter sp. M-5]
MTLRAHTARIARLSGVATLCLALAGCGFQLRGAPPVPAGLQPLAVSCVEQIPAELCQAVKEQLELGDIDVRSPDEADFLLRLQSFEQDRRANAITAQAAAAEYTLRQIVTIEVLTREELPLIAETRLNSSETYRFDETNVLAKQREEQELRQQLFDRLAQQIIFRLAPLTDARIAEIRRAAEEDSSQDSR